MALFTLIEQQPWLAVSVAMLFSLMVGSFLNVVIYRLPVMMQKQWDYQLAEYQAEQAGTELPEPTETFNLAVPASSCPHCQHKIRFYENIPLISYLLLRGRCSGCRSSISIRYPAIELLTALMSGWVVYSFGANWSALAVLFITWVLIALTFIDIDHQLLPDSITLPLIWIGLLLNTQGLFTSLEQAVWGAVLGYLSLWSVYWLFKLATGKEGMGFGDFKLLAALGAWAGASQLPLIILLSSLVGAILGSLMMLLDKEKRGNPIPFGPYLAIAGWIALIWGNDIVSSYLKMLAI